MHTLYLMVGYPGAGKTTTAQFISELTGAKHLWTAQFRREWFGNPTFQSDETKQLYERLNDMAEYMLRKGESVIFDTSFNFYKDRQRLSKIAARASANTVVIWVKAPKDLAKERAVMSTSQHAHIRILGNMEPERFEHLSEKLEPPHKNETHIVVDGTKVTKAHIAKQLAQLA